MIAKMIGIEIVIAEKGGDMDRIGVEGLSAQEPEVDTTDLQESWTGVTGAALIGRRVIEGMGGEGKMTEGRREEVTETESTEVTMTGKRREDRGREKRKKKEDPTGTTVPDLLKESPMMTVVLYTRMIDPTDQVGLAPGQAQCLTTANMIRAMGTGISGQYYSSSRLCYSSSTCSSSR